MSKSSIETISERMHRTLSNRPPLDMSDLEEAVTRAWKQWEQLPQKRITEFTTKEIIRELSRRENEGELDDYNEMGFYDYNRHNNAFYYVYGHLIRDENVVIQFNSKCDENGDQWIDDHEDITRIINRQWTKHHVSCFRIKPENEF